MQPGEHEKNRKTWNLMTQQYWRRSYAWIGKCMDQEP